MPNIYDVVKPKEIKAFYTEGASNKMPYLGETLFPAEKQMGLDLRWIKGSKGLPVALKPSAFDTETSLRDRVGFEELETEMPFFKEGTLIKERDRMELNRVLSNGESAYADMIIKHIFDDITNLVQGVKVQSERMVMQLLSTGKIAIAANGANYDYDYKFPTENKETLLTTNRWSDTSNSDPVADIERWQEAIEATSGVKPNRAICTRATWNYLKANAKIKADIDPTGKRIVTDTILEDYFDNKLELEIARYNKKFKSEAGVDTQFFPDDVFTLIPSEELGNLYFGTTPEESDLLSGATSAEVEVVDNGIAVTTEKRTDPVNVFTKVSAIMLPSFESIDSVFIANVNG